MSSGIPLEVLDVLTSGALVKTSLILTIGLSIGAVVSPRRVARARESAAAARVSPLWLLTPLAAFMAALFIPADLPPVLVLSILITQVGLTGWIVYRHRRWPWVALPLAVAVLTWYGVIISAIALGGMAH